jgi:hypothetical protein
MNVEKIKQLWAMGNELLAPCPFTGFINTYFSIGFNRICCFKTTHYPTRMMQCNSLEDDLLGVILPESIRDQIYLAKSSKVESIPPVVSESKVHDIKLFANYPISCKIGNVTVLSWNVNGRCDSRYSEGQITPRRDNMIEVVKKINPDIWCIQNFYMRSKVDNRFTTTDTVERILSSLPKYKVVYDKYTDVILVKSNLFIKTKMVISRYNDAKKKTTILYIADKIPFYVVNVHLRTIKGVSTHEMEMAEVLDQLNQAEKFKAGASALFIGTFNDDTPDEVLKKARKYKFMRGGKTRKV